MKMFAQTFWVSIGISAFCILYSQPGSCASDPNQQKSVYTTVSISSDYRNYGVSLNGRKATPQLSIYLALPENFYAGFWTSKVDFNDPNETSYEIDIYAGKRFTSGPTTTTFELLYTGYPDSGNPDPTYNFLQLKGEVQFSIMSHTIRPFMAWSPEGSYGIGKVWIGGIEWRRNIHEVLTFRSEIGRRWVETSVERTYYELGLVLERNAFAFELDYVTTNLDEDQCRFTDNCNPGIVGKISLSF